MLNKKELIKSLEKFSKFTIVGLTSLALVGGSLSSTASAKGAEYVGHTSISRRVNKNNYQLLVNYLNWVHHYDHTHKYNWHSYKLAHLYEYMNDLTYDQYHNIETLFNKNYNLYYNHDNSMKNAYKYFKDTKNLSNKVYKRLLYLFNADSINQNSKNDKALNSYLSHNWHNLTNSQLMNLSHSYNIDSFLNTDYNLYKLHEFNKIYNKLIIKGSPRFTATNKVKELGKQDNNFDTEVRADLIEDINNTRKHYGRRPLIVTNAMQATANYRNPRVIYAYNHINDYMKYPHNTSNPLDNWIHGVSTHTSDDDYLTNNHYIWKDDGANATNTFKNNNSLYGDGTPLKYNNNTAKGFADNVNNSFMNHDNCQGNNNGHRDNELNKNWRYLGVGVNYDNAAHMGSVNEQFAC